MSDDREKGIITGVSSGRGGSGRDERYTCTACYSVAAITHRIYSVVILRRSENHGLSIPTLNRA